MVSRINIIAIGAALACGMAGSAYAAVTAEEARQLGKTLTPMGGEMAGNKDGKIPAWTGGMKTLPPGFDPKKPHLRPDPFASEKPLFSIDAKNMSQHADKLSDGMKAMMQKYPTFRIDVYPTHRTAAWPQYVMDNTLKNATRCSTEKDGVAISRACYGGYPFPIPKTGNEVMWNKILRFAGHVFENTFTHWVVDASGTAALSSSSFARQEYVYYDPSKTELDGDYFWKYRDKTTAPARMSGEALMLVDPIDPIANKRKAYQYLPGQRRVKLSPNLSYDTPTPGQGGAATMDDAQLFLGAQDRFDFKLIGKKEMYIPYNNTRVMVDEQNCSPEKALLKHHYNPDCLRFELHRVWVVEATVKPGVRHTSPKRVFYFDEDTYVGLSDGYDAVGKLQKVLWQTHTPMYEIPSQHSDAFGSYNLTSGAYVVSGPYPGGAAYPVKPLDARAWAPEALVGDGVR
ncbi:DUF1329 domain-containing protein [Noviherbaspirillum sedimenti]|uniref:DUF1329 domain-containing protein n=1 Tax=Noviherbaspirillum sedimenti TaxID=2320865 RepID=A0A3A3G406_9BURK|nr:DUF1329 domain-containing protein [Noviherbaspirillum sedimenti]RJG03218.1 DUF1329 domain-containing protein [Noviherbaspirillum sedimenti]